MFEYLNRAIGLRRHRSASASLPVYRTETLLDRVLRRRAPEESVLLPVYRRSAAGA
ncbi:MAG: hypothetical protein AAF074_24000 [Pseudomonadota bacterium]